MINEEKVILNEIENKIEQTKTIPTNIENKINKRILENLLICIGIIIYAIYLIFGFKNIEKTQYITNLKIASLLLGLFAIVIFEYSYKKENTKTCIWGIETLMLSILTLFCIYIYFLNETKYIFYIALFAYIFAIYYILKNIKIYKKIKKEYIKSLSDINEIIKKDEPEKKETQRKRR